MLNIVKKKKRNIHIRLINDLINLQKFRQLIFASKLGFIKCSNNKKDFMFPKKNHEFYAIYFELFIISSDRSISTLYHSKDNISMTLDKESVKWYQWIIARMTFQVLYDLHQTGGYTLKSISYFKNCLIHYKILKSRKLYKAIRDYFFKLKSLNDITLN